jgi:hypothetical protein
MEDMQMGMSFFYLNPQEDQMIKAEITVGTRYGKVDIPVEVYATGPRPGTAFQDSTSIVLVPQLRNIHLIPTLEMERSEVYLLCPENQELEVS